MSHSALQDLFAPLKLGALNLAHRIVLDSPRALPHAPLPRTGDTGTRTAAGGLTIYAVADEQCAEHPHPFAHGLASAGEVNGWLHATHAIHERGGMVIARIGGCPAPADIRLDADQIDLALDAYRTAAENANDAGFDGVELAATAGTLPDRLCRSAAAAQASTDVATTDCPVATEFLCDALRAILAAWPADRVGVCMTLPSTAEELRTLQRLLSPLLTGELAWLHLHSAGSGHATCCKPFTSGVRLRHAAPLIVTGRWTAQLAATAVRSGRIDAAGVHGDMAMPSDELVAAWRAQLGGSA
ncbi:hypothetical protein [Cupriavidus oxalaticus]|uniref:hypothetical protein n=1 Tax=Cupriavidus oxalaticus TaxID=96344 RepID=UPI0031822141